ncbi:hypothetical protein LX32DRAFT_158585 [Colletotrichum zoysiae]|uniref:Uncharacterized protein n=1 Tax=Colletotrichum zoysiae TaxID=1216348 RepID=A0AAD9HRD2_9PEZI|nr:hypothetical protein LX32DRAFT_158585 [Colletotrichum zoysiae]
MPERESGVGESRMAEARHMVTPIKGGFGGPASPVNTVKSPYGRYLTAFVFLGCTAENTNNQTADANPWRPSITYPCHSRPFEPPAFLAANICHPACSAAQITPWKSNTGQNTTRQIADKFADKAMKTARRAAGSARGDITASYAKSLKSQTMLVMCDLYHSTLQDGCSDPWGFRPAPPGGTEKAAFKV